MEGFDREGELRLPSFSPHTSWMFTKAGGLANGRLEPEIQSKFSVWVTKTQLIDPPAESPRVCNRRKLESRANPRINPATPLVNTGITRPSAHSPKLF